jgi:hypothetical protein
MVATPVVRRLVELASLAPSLHNTQPWRWVAKGDTLRLYADHSRLLPAEDPLGRSLVISCGAALDHLLVAVRALGLDAEVTRFPERADPDLLAAVRLRPGTPSPTAGDDIAVLRTRCTDRRRFTSWPVPDEAIDQLIAEASARGVVAVAVTDPGDRFRLELLTHQAHSLRSLDAAAIREQRTWVGSRQVDGIPVAVLPAEAGPVAARFATGLAPDTRPLVDSCDGVVALGGDSDDPAHWLRTGEGLSALWLRATRDGLSVVPLSLPVEVEATRDGLRDEVLGQCHSPHLLVRIGWQAIGRSQLPRTPRRPVDDVLRVRG